MSNDFNIAGCEIEHAIRVSYNNDNGTNYIKYILVQNDNKESNIYIDKESVKNFLVELQNELEELSFNQLNEDRRNSVFRNFRNKSKLLFRSLIPKQIRDEIKSWSPNTTLNIISEKGADFIPWEILHDENDFLGNQFMIIRRPGIDSFDDYNSFHEDSPLFCKSPCHNINILVHIIGGDLKKDEEKASKLFYNFIPEFNVEDQECLNLKLSVPAPNEIPQSEEIPLVQECLNSQLSVLTPYETSFLHPHLLNIKKKPLETLVNVSHLLGNILHFTCHGRTYGPEKSKIYLQIDAEYETVMNNLVIESIQEDTDFEIKRGSLVFANACGSNSGQLTLEGFITFGEVFLSKGAKYFIGTLGTIPTELAIQFSHYFYDELLIKNKIFLLHLFMQKN